MRTLLTVMALPFILPGTADAQHWTRTVETTVNVRAGPGTEHSVVDQVEAGEYVYVSRDRQFGWHPVFHTPTSDDTVGWISGDLLVSPAASSSPDPVSTAQTGGSDSGGISAGWWLFLFALYFLPALRATIRGHHNASAIGLLNFFFGWTVLGWLGALIWAETAVDESKK